jgi:hypothetical protein
VLNELLVDVRVEVEVIAYKPLETEPRRSEPQSSA